MFCYIYIERDEDEYRESKYCISIEIPLSANPFVCHLVRITEALLYIKIFVTRHYLVKLNSNNNR